MTPIHIAWSDDGQHIRKWSREPFEGSTPYSPAPAEPEGEVVERVARAIVTAFAASTPDLAHSLSLDWQDWSKEALAALQAAGAGREGWVLVPRVPTEAMVKVWENACPKLGWTALQDLSDDEANRQLVEAEWSAMLAAAPKHGREG